MNILYILGNGFDINLGLKTRYSEFYEYYQQQESEDELVIALKKSIASGIDNWSDLELAFGNYTKNLNDMDEFDRVWEDIVDHLGKYLENEEENFDAASIDIERFLKDLSNPEHGLAQGNMDEIDSFKQKFGTAAWNINVISLNYTRTIERILKGKYPNTHIGAHRNGHILFGDIQHIHGYTDARTILGVNDESQVGKIDFRTNREILEALIKTTSNQAQKHNVDKICTAYIQSASIICIFGSSLGDTDNYIWELIGNELKKGIKLLIFKKGEPINQRFGHRSARSQRTIKKLFLNKTTLSDNEKEEAQDNIYVALNTNMFSI